MSLSEISLEVLKTPPSRTSLWEDDMSSKASIIGHNLPPRSAPVTLSRRQISPSELNLRNDTRSFNTMNFASLNEASHNPLPHLETVSSKDQEMLLIQELLYILSGAQSCIIHVHHPSPSQITFSVDGRIENSLKELSLQIAQLAVYYHSVTRFVENWCKFEHGQVNQALAAALRDILKDYFILLSQTETLHLKGELTLQKMWFFIHPTLQVMAILSAIVLEIEKQKYRGGRVLSLLHEKAVAMVGDAVGQNLCYNLAQKASAPYFILLENWIYKGMIRDPFHEFFVYDSDKGEGFIEANDNIDNDNYWDTRYQLVPDKCPLFLKSVHQEILKAGKYLNVIRQCGKDVTLITNNKIAYSIHERVYVAAIEKAYAFASKTLLDLLLNEYDLMKRLKSVKHYLLMDQGDFIVQFLDLTEKELSKQIDDINFGRLESLLELALRTSSSNTDPYKDCLKAELFPFGIAEQMLKIIAIETPMEQQKAPLSDDFNYQIPGFEGFAFKYEVEWPISLVLNSRAIVCYQMIFRHLFFCKHVERQLCRVWIAKKSFKDSDLTNDPDKASSFSLHQKMLNFVQNLQYYMAFEVIEPAWHVFITTMGKVANVDQVLDCHVTMFNSILADSMLTSPSLLARMTRLLALCLQFSVKVVGNNDDLTPVHLTTINVTVEELTASFNKELIEFLKEVSDIVQNPNNQFSKMANIIYRVNFNGFYTEALENDARE